jgi:hypothetical protein
MSGGGDGGGGDPQPVSTEVVCYELVAADDRRGGGVSLLSLAAALCRPFVVCRTKSFVPCALPTADDGSGPRGISHGPYRVLSDLSVSINACQAFSRTPVGAPEDSFPTMRDIRGWPSALPSKISIVVYRCVSPSAPRPLSISSPSLVPSPLYDMTLSAPTPP